MALRRASPVLVGHGLALFSTIIWSSLYIFARAMAGNYTPLELSFWRWAVAALAFLPFVWHGVWAHRALIRSNWLHLAVISLIGIPGFSIMIFLAGKTTTATNMSLLAATCPIFIALISRFVLHETLARQQIVGLCIAVAGVLVLITKGNLGNLLTLTLSIGDVWMLLGAMCFAAYSLLLRLRPAQMPPNVFLEVLMGFGALMLLPCLLVQWLWVQPFVMLAVPDMISILYIGIGTSVIAFLAWNAAVARIGAVRAGVVYYSLPFFSCIMAFLALGERLEVAQLLGGALIIGGIVLSSLSMVRCAVKK